MESPFCDPALTLIETFAWDGAQFVRLARHRARMAASAAALGFGFTAAGFDAALPAAPGPSPLRLRLTLDRAGRFAQTAEPLARMPVEWRVDLADGRMTAEDPRLAHKTSDRATYDQTRATLPQGVDEILFLNQRDELTEGAITTLFFDLGQGMATPPLTCGCLPGCLRAELLESGLAHEEIGRAHV